MLMKNLCTTAAAVLFAIDPTYALRGSRNPLLPRREYARAVDTSKASVEAAQNVKRQYFPANATDVQNITTPSGATIRYKDPGDAGECETTPGESFL